MNKKFICKCGHIQKEHHFASQTCWPCAVSGEWCTKFVGDNLKYIEDLVK
jgi:hypothetical protein